MPLGLVQSRQTDRKRRIRAHHEICTGVLKKSVRACSQQFYRNMGRNMECWHLCACTDVCIISLVIYELNVAYPFPFSTFGFLFNDVSSDWSPSIILWWFPFEVHMVLIIICNFRPAWWPWRICSRQKQWRINLYMQIYFVNSEMNHLNNFFFNWIYCTYINQLQWILLTPWIFGQCFLLCYKWFTFTQLINSFNTEHVAVLRLQIWNTALSIIYLGSKRKGELGRTYHFTKMITKLNLNLVKLSNLPVFANLSFQWKIKPS